MRAPSFSISGRGIHAADSHFGLAVTSRAGRAHLPVCKSPAIRSISWTEYLCIAREGAKAAHQAVRTFAAGVTQYAHQFHVLISSPPHRVEDGGPRSEVHRDWLPAGHASEICRIAGPLNPRCVNSTFSTNDSRRTLPGFDGDAAQPFTTTPVFARERHGTRPGRVVTRPQPELLRNFVSQPGAPRGEIESPPVATTSDSHINVPALVVSSNRSDRETTSTEQPVRPRRLPHCTL